MADDDLGLLRCVKVIVKAQEFRDANSEHKLSAAHCVDGALAEMELKVSDEVHDALCAAVLCDWFTPVMAQRELERRVRHEKTTLSDDEEKH